MGQSAELSTEIDHAVQDNPIEHLVLSTAADSYRLLDDRKRASPWRTWSCVSIRRCRKSQLGFLVDAYFFGRKFERAIGLS